MSDGTGYYDILGVMHEAALVIPAIDIYLTYRCNLRCKHCFVGERLNTARNFDADLLDLLIDSCTSWQTREVTLLGGEPTLYPDIIHAIENIQARGIRVRLVTNGLSGLHRLISQFRGPTKPSIGFSIDGSRASIHEKVRGSNTFDRMVANIAQCKLLGFPIFGVTSISRQNMDDVLDILALSQKLKLEYLNVHYVVAVGFADSSIVLPAAEWQIVSDKIRREAERLAFDVRIEDLVLEESSELDPCAVRNNNNLMFLPDGRVYSCPLFMDMPNAHSYTWGRNGLVPSKLASSEKAICSKGEFIACPAMSLMNPDAVNALSREGIRVGCVLSKTRHGWAGRQP